MFLFNQSKTQVINTDHVESLVAVDGEKGACVVAIFPDGRQELLSDYKTFDMAKMALRDIFQPREAVRMPSYADVDLSNE